MSNSTAEGGTTFEGTISIISRSFSNVSMQSARSIRGMRAVDLEHPKRLVFEPDHDPRPEKDDGGLDWHKVTAVRICEIIDYH